MHLLAIEIPSLDFERFLQSVTAMEMVLKGLVIGIVVSAPMGPVGVLTVQRTLNKGRWQGFATGVGAALSDISYALVTGCGLSFVFDFIEDVRVAFWIKLVGGCVLFLFGLYTFRTQPEPKPLRPRKSIKGKKESGSLLSYGVSGFLWTVSNPLIIFLYVALFGQFTFILPDHPFPQVVGYLSIVAGALLWWFVLTWIIDKVRTRFQERGISIINRIIGGAVMIVSAYMVLYTIGVLTELNDMIQEIKEINDLHGVRIH